MNQFIYHYFYDSDRETVLNLFNLNDITSFEKTSSRGYEIKWRCAYDYSITYYLYFAVNRYDMLNQLKQDIYECRVDTELFNLDGTFAFYTYQLNNVDVPFCYAFFTSEEQEALRKDSGIEETPFILIMNRCITDTFPKNGRFNSVPHWETVTSKDGCRTFKIRRIVNE